MKVKNLPDPKIAERLRVLMQKSKTLNTQAALAKKSGVGQRTISRILNSEVDSSLSIYKSLCEALGVPHDTLTSPDASSDPLFNANSGVVVKTEDLDSRRVATVTREELLLWTEGGKRLKIIPYRENREFVAIDMETNQATHNVLVEDDAMQDTLPINSFAIVDPQREPVRGNLVEVRTVDNQITFRQYKPLSNGSFELLAENQLYDTLAESDVEQIIGVVLFSLKKLV